MNMRQLSSVLDPQDEEEQMYWQVQCEQEDPKAAWGEERMDWPEKGHSWTQTEEEDRCPPQEKAYE